MKKLAIAGLAAVSLAGCSGQEEEAQVLNLYNWSEYMPQEVLDRFEEETGIEVIYTTYDSNEAMYARLKLLDDSSQYDLAVPSTYYVNKMRKEGLLTEIDHNQIEGFDNLDPELVDQSFDKDNAYSVPYLWGTTGLAIDSDAVEEGEVTGWADLWDEQYEGQVMLTNDMREVFHVGLRVLGYSGNSTDPDEIGGSLSEAYRADAVGTYL